MAQWSRCCATNRKVAGSIPAGVSGFFIDIKSFRSHYGPGVDSASNRNEYQEYLLGAKGGRCIRLTTLPTSCAVAIKSGNLKFLEPSGPLRACNGTALPLLFTKYLSGNQISKGIGEGYGTYRGEEGAYRVLLGKREGRSSLGIPRHKWEDNIRMGFHKVG